MKYLAVLFFSVAVFCGVIKTYGDHSFFEDFESAQQGQPVGLVNPNFVGAFADLLVEPVGVNGSLGFCSDVVTNFPFGALYFVEQPTTIVSVGDRLSFSVDISLDNPKTFGSQNYSRVCQIAVGSVSNFVMTGIVRSGPDYNEFANFRWYKANGQEDYEEGNFAPVSNIGLSENAPLETSNFFTLKIEIEKTGTYEYGLVTQICDLDGNILSSTSIEDVHLQSVFNTSFSPPLEISFLDVYAVDSASKLYFDNIRFELERVPVAVSPDFAETTEGTLVSGDETNLQQSDNLDFSIRRSATSIQSRTEFVCEARTAMNVPTSLSLTLEGSVFARTEVVQTVEFYVSISIRGNLSVLERRLDSSIVRWWFPQAGT